MLKRHFRIATFIIVGVFAVGAYLIARAATINAPTVNVTDTSATITWTTIGSTDSCIFMALHGQTFPTMPWGGTENGCTNTNASAPIVTSHTVTAPSLSPNTQYDYKVGYESPGGPAYDVVRSFWTTGGSSSIPPAPTSLSASPAPTATAVYLSWPDVSGEDKYNVERKLHSDSIWPTSWLMQVGANVITYTDTTVAAGTTYDYRVQACLSGYGCSAYTYLYSVSTLSGGGSAPSAPTLTAPASSGVPVVLSWTSSTNATKYQVYRRTPPGTGTWTQVGFDLPTTNLTDWGLTAGLNYEYHVNACNTSGCSGDSNWALVSVTGGTTALALSVTQPAGGTCMTNNFTFSIYWNTSGDTSSLDHFTLSYWEGGAYKQNLNGSIAKTANSFSWTTLSSSNTDQAQVKVEAWNSSGTLLTSVLSPYFGVRSSCSTATSSTTSGGGSIPPAPSSLTANPAPTATAVYLSWPDVSGEDKYNVYRKLHSDSAWPTMYMAQVGVNVTSYPDATVLAGTNYDYRVEACLSGYGCSGTTGSYAYLYGIITPSGTSGGSAPQVMGWGLGVDTATGKSTIGIAFNQAMDPASFTDSSAYLYLANDLNTIHVASQITPASTYVNLVPVSPLTAGTVYISVVKAGVKSSTGGMLQNDHICKFTALSSGQYTSCPGDLSVSPTPTPSPTPSPTTSPLPTGLNTVKTIKGKITSSTGLSITDADVYVWRQDTGASFKGSTDASGNYVLMVYGGSWQINIHPKSIASTWAYSEPPRLVGFAADNTTETRQLDFSVFTASSRIKGFVKNADGSIPIKISVGADNGTGFSQGGPIASDGSFGFSLPAGSYTLRIFQEGTGSVGLEPYSFTLGDNETKDFGVIMLVAKSDRIAGKVIDTAGHALANIPIRAFIFGTSSFVQASTQSDGTYTLFVTPGTWQVRAEPYPESNYANPEAPISVSVVSGVPAQANFKLIFSDATITGSVIDDASGAVVTELYGYVAVGDFTSLSNFGGPVSQGRFSFRAQAGTYALKLGVSPDSGYAPPSLQTVTVSPGTTKTVTFRATKNAALITGQIKDDSGVALKNLSIRIAASSGTGAWQEGFYNPDTGSYRINVSQGTWYLGVSAEKLSGYVPPDPGALVVAAEQGKSVTQDIILKKVGFSRIIGTARKPDGTPFPHVFVSADTPYGGAAQTTQGNYPAGFGAETDANGAYVILVPPGSYRVRAFAPPSLGFQNPGAIDVTVANGETRNVDLAFRSSSAVISGHIEGISGKAFVYAWSDKGGYAEAESAEDGTYALNVTKGETWKVATSKEVDKTLFRASDTPVVIGQEDSVRQNLTALPTGKKLPDPVSTVGETTQVNIVGVKDGASIAVPPNAISAAGRVTITVTPDTRAATQSQDRVVGIGYAVEIRGSDAKSITTFNADAVLSIPYTDADLAALGASPSALSLSFWDETVGAWRSVPNAVVDTKNKVVSGSVNHLTRFALVAPADTQPPDPPYGVKVARTGNGFLVTWSNPTYDFHHAKLYRSSTKGVLGDVIFDNLATTSKEDPTAAVSGITFYYTVRVVDLAGNESVNTTQYTTAGATQTPSQKELGPQAVPSTTPAAATSSSPPAPNPQIPAYQKYANSTLLRATGDQKVWIITNGFKRYVVGPQVLGFYGHLKNAPIIDVPASELDQYSLAAWVRYVNNPKVYEVNDDATKHWLDMSAEDFYNTGRRWEAVFIVNKAEIDFYRTGVNVTIIK